MTNPGKDPALWPEIANPPVCGAVNPDHGVTCQLPAGHVPELHKWRRELDTAPEGTWSLARADWSS